MRYPTKGGLKQKNIISEVHHVNVHNFRLHCDHLDFDTCGFDVLHLQTCMGYDDFDDESKIATTYVSEVSEALKRRLGAKHVCVVDYAVALTLTRQRTAERH